MIRTTASAAALLLSFAAAAASAAPAPASGRAGAEYEAAERLFLRAGPAQPLLELSQRWQYEQRRPYSALMAGGYARAARWLKVGAFYKLQHGARHDDDWTRDALGQWAWRDTARRPEHLWILDVSPRAALPWLPGRTWTGLLKLRYERNTTFHESVLRVEPELDWFWLDGLTPRATLSLRHETAFALDFGERRVWQRWTYAAALWHARPWLSLGPNVGYREEVWSTSADFRARSAGGASYRTLFRAWIAGLNAVARLP